jgi:hypothetical protein
MSLLGLSIVGGQGTATGLGLWHLNPVARHLEKIDGSLVHRPEPLVLNAAAQKTNGSGLASATNVPN